MITRESVRGVFPVVPLEETAEFLDYLRKPVKQSDRVEGPYPYYGANGLQGTIDGYLFDEPLILVAEDGGHFDTPERGIAYQINGKAWVNNHAHVLRPKENVDIRYLTRVLENYDVRPFINGSTRAKLTKGQAKNIEIPLPPLEEQKRIAGILDQADALRRLRSRALDKLNTLGELIFHEMFGDPLKEQRNSPDWTLETLDSSISYVDYRGKTPPKAPVGIRLITAKNVKMGYINPEPMEFILEKAFSGWMTRGFPKKGDVLFTTEAPLGNVAILDSDQTLAVGQRLLTMQPDHSKIASEYLAFYLRTPEFTKRMIENSSGSTVRGIKSKLLKKIEICYPSLQRQEDFAEALHAHNTNKSTYENAAQHSQALFASLQHRAFRGEL